MNIPFVFHARCFAVAAILSNWLSSLALADKPIDFNRDIRPILSDNCFYCHGPDPKHRQADLRLDQREAAIASNVIVAGKPDQSRLLERILSEDPEQVMPPPSSHKKLSPDQKRRIQQWIAEGAVYQTHWSYAELRRPELPLASANARSQSTIDAYIQEKLDEAKIIPSTPAPAWRLVRRIFLDLIGIPPTPDEVDTWSKSLQRDGVEPLIDHLLATPHFGERMALGWLDVVRYTDTVGFHGDQNQNIFPYRDYVIQAFNDNKPFDRFTVEQLAGDLLPHPHQDQLIATGFNRLNMMTREGGAQPEEYLSKYASDRVRTVGMAWLGSTIGCAECHDHKFDPFTSRDFYSMSAFFADVTQWGVYADYGYTPNLDLKGYTNDHPFPPEIELTSPTLLQLQSRLAQEIAQYLQRPFLNREKDVQKVQDWARDTADVLKQHRDGWIPIQFHEHVSSTESATLVNGQTLLFRSKSADDMSSDEKSQDQKSDPKEKIDRVKKSGNEKAKTNATQSRLVKLLLPTGRMARIQIRLLPLSDTEGSILRDQAKNSDLQWKVSLQRVNRSEAISLNIQRADANWLKPRYVDGQPAIGVENTWSLDPSKLNQTHIAVLGLKEPIAIESGDMLLLDLKGNHLASLQVHVSPVADIDLLNGQATPAALESFAEGHVAFGSTLASEVFRMWYFSTQTPSKDAKLDKLIRDYRECRNGLTWSMITVARAPTATRILPRGNWQDDSGDVVEPSTPGFLPSLVSPPNTRKTRLDLARWIVSRENPLTARVVVNRFWKQLFGQGLCNTVDDFGLQGDHPSHPELLDYLASEFIDSGWNVKAIIKQIAMSQAYRRSAEVREDLRDIDPQNRWLAAQNPRRLDAELIRDNALAIAGCLDTDIIGGPSCKPYQPPGYYANLQFPDRDYVPDANFGRFRRGVYMHWQRTFLHPMLANFDAPSREECIASRVISNTPQQALTLLNDPVFLEAAIEMASTLFETPTKLDSERMNLAMRRTLAREATTRESNELLAFLQEQRDYFQTNEEAAMAMLNHSESWKSIVNSHVTKGELAAWTSLCRVLLNLHETLVRY